MLECADHQRDPYRAELVSRPGPEHHTLIAAFLRFQSQRKNARPAFCAKLSRQRGSEAMSSMKAKSLLAGILSITIWFGVLAPFPAIWSPVRASVVTRTTAAAPFTDAEPIKICLAAPQVTSGTITGDAFNDRLVAALSADSQFLVERLDAAEDDTIRRQQAAQHGCDYLLMLTLSSDEGKSKPAAVAEKVGKVFDTHQRNKAAGLLQCRLHARQVRRANRPLRNVPRRSMPAPRTRRRAHLLDE